MGGIDGKTGLHQCHSELPGDVGVERCSQPERLTDRVDEAEPVRFGRFDRHTCDPKPVEQSRVERPDDVRRERVEVSQVSEQVSMIRTQRLENRIDRRQDVGMPDRQAGSRPRLGHVGDHPACHPRPAVDDPIEVVDLVGLQPSTSEFVDQTSTSETQMVDPDHLRSREDQRIEQIGEQASTREYDVADGTTERHVRSEFSLRLTGPLFDAIGHDRPVRVPGDLDELSRIRHGRGIRQSSDEVADSLGLAVAGRRLEDHPDGTVIAGFV